jgi:hypothetical protein
MIQMFEAKRALQKIEQSFVEVVSLTLSTHPSPWKGVSTIGRPTPASPSREPRSHRSGPHTNNSRRHHQKKEEHPHLHMNK